MHAYAEKAMREASDGTTWTAPDASYEAAVHEAVDAAYQDPRLRAAWDEIDRLITAPGWSNALGQKLVQLTMPGVPDIYQGTELWEDSLVDPDNRRPVDFANRARAARLVPERSAQDRRNRRSQALDHSAGTSATPETARVLQQLPTARRARTRR